MDHEVRQQLRAIAEQYHRNTTGCHRLDHVIRVVGNARALAVSYPEADAELLEAAAWLHDIGRGSERHSGVSHAEISARLAAPLLPTLGFSPARTRIALEAIADHRYSSGRTPASLEGKLLQDADRLDALGAIGAARTFIEGANRELYDPGDPFALHRPLDDDAYSLDHFFTKLLTLPATMHTPEARAQGEQRVAFLRAFVQQLATEIDAVTDCGAYVHPGAGR